MAVIKHELPILEYDEAPAAILQPDHEHLGLKLPKKAVFAFLGGCIGRYAREHELPQAAEFVSITKKYPVYVVNYKEEEICLCQAPVGAPAAVQILDWLISYGVETVISSGSCGALTDLPENAFLIPTRALRDEGTSYHYLPPSRWVELDEGVRASMKRTLDGLGLPCAECAVWTTDGFFRETRELVEYRKAEGCSVVDMECAALVACAQFRGVRFGQLLFTADSLANADQYDERGWGTESLEKALMLSLELVRALD